jgi:CheY-like chemotaxis protein
MTSLAKGTDEEQKKQYYLSKIEEASTHLLGVINDILDISKIEANKFELSPSVFSFEKMLQRVVNIIHFRVMERQQEIIVSLDPHLPAYMESDEQHLAQVITNLLSNALKFTPEGGKIRIGSQILEESNNLCTIQISVKDTGIGIPQESQDRIFNSFEQMDQSTSRKFGGTGLGLSISKRIVEMMGGTIWVESVLGEGATFAFTVKARRCQEQEVSKMMLDAAVEITNKDGIFEGKRLLVAEDVKINREIILAQLAPTKIEIDCAVNGLEAVEQFKKCGGKYDLIFMDMQMPEMDGIEATVAIRALALPEAKTVPIIALTANVFRDDIEKCLAAGMNDHLGKPIEFSVMLQKMKSCLNSAPPMRKTFVDIPER